MTLSFLRTNGTNVVNEFGEAVILRGVGLGNWLLPEGYMWLFGETDKDRPRRIEALIESLVGKEEAQLFWETFYQTYTTKADVEKIAQLGFNSIRLPIHYRFIQDEDGNWIEQRLQLIDDFIQWCEESKLYVILDLHGAPGGQTGANIDDSENDFPELFTTRKYQIQTIEIWKLFASKYRHRAVIAGYDLLNEPLPAHFSQFNPNLIAFYDELIREVRAIDPEHIIILEGANWANDWSIFQKPYDNVILQAHKYWNNPDTESIQHFLDISKTYHSPLWIGETGENIPSWYIGSYQMLADHHVGWNLWPWKRMGSPRNPYTIKTPKNWDQIIKHAKGEIKLCPKAAKSILNDYLDNIKLEQCIYNEEVICSVLKSIPLTIPAPYYNYQGPDMSYHSEGTKVQEIDFRRHDQIKVTFLEEQSPIAIKQKKTQMLTEELCLYIEGHGIEAEAKLALLHNEKQIEKLIKAIAVKEKIMESTVVAYIEKYRYLIKNQSLSFNHIVSELKLINLNFWHSRSEEDVFNERLVIELQALEWVTYDIYAPKCATYQISVNAKSDVETLMGLEVEGEVQRLQGVGQSFSNLIWQCELKQGGNQLKIRVESGCAKVFAIEVK